MSGLFSKLFGTDDKTYSEIGSDQLTPTTVPSKTSNLIILPKGDIVQSGSGELYMLVEDAKVEMVYNLGKYIDSVRTK